MTKSIVTGIYGSVVDLNDPGNSIIILADVAHRLSHINRYNGGTKLPFSVAQHSLAIDDVLRKNGAGDRVRLLALLHDCTEAFVGDMISPLKHNFKDFIALEDKLFDVITNHITYCPKFTQEQWDIVKEHDKKIRLAEWITLNHNQFHDRAGAWAAEYGENPAPQRKYVSAIRNQLQNTADVVAAMWLNRVHILLTRIEAARNEA